MSDVLRSPALAMLRDGDGRFWAACAIWLIAFVTIGALLPALPVDETRYLTVAWEMHQSGNWLLPTLDGAPYSHKPPLLFWLINLVWAFGDETVAAARMVSVATAAGVAVLTFRFARVLVPGAAPLATLLFLAMPGTLLYAPLIMFDMLLAIAVLLGLMALWRLAAEPSWRNALLLGLAIGAGLIAKGPVIVVHILPAALLVRLWHPAGAPLPLRPWLARIGVAIAIGAVVILAWAIPAAISGGRDFAEMIFWKQSAGRMVNAFDHKRPFWFFVPVLVVFLLPLFLWRPFWIGLARLRTQALSPVQLFLASWLVPAFLMFSAISGKQPHYLLPLLPGIAIFIASLIRTEDHKASDIRGIAVIFAVLSVAMLLLPPALVTFARDTPTGFIKDGIGTFNPLITIAAFTAGAIALLVLRGTTLGQAAAISIAGSILMLTLVVQCQLGLLRFYDLRPLARAIDPFEAQPVAAAMRYAGEVSFLTRLRRPVQEIRLKDLDAWFAAHPGAIALLRHRTPVTKYKVVFTQPYRRTDYFSIVQAMPAALP